MLHVAGSAVGFAARGAVTGGAGRARRGAVDGVECQVTTVARQAPLSVAFNTSHNFHPLIVQRVKLIAAPLVIRIRRLARGAELS